MSEPEMVQRVRSAILAVMRSHGDGEYVGETGRAANLTSIDGDFDMAAVARAAIEAMREPTEAMRHAVWYDQYITCGGSPEMADKLAWEKVGNPTQRHQDLSSFSALIDAALAEPTAPR